MSDVERALKASTILETFPNGCNYRFIVEGDKYYIEFGCYGVHVNLVQGLHRSFLHWFQENQNGNGRVLVNDILEPEDIAECLKKKPCLQCGGHRFRAALQPPALDVERKRALEWFEIYFEHCDRPEHLPPDIEITIISALSAPASKPLDVKDLLKLQLTCVRYVFRGDDTCVTDYDKGTVDGIDKAFQFLNERGLITPSTEGGT